VEARVLNRRESTFKKAAQRLFDSEDGLMVLAYLQDSYVKTTALADSPELTYYKLGQKELIQLLVSTIKDPESLDNVDVYTNLSDDY
jgi:hypothetical protein